MRFFLSFHHTRNILVFSNMKSPAKPESYMDLFACVVFEARNWFSSVDLEMWHVLCGYRKAQVKEGGIGVWGGYGDRNLIWQDKTGADLITLSASSSWALFFWIMGVCARWYIAQCILNVYFRLAYFPWRLFFWYSIIEDIG